MVSWESVMGLDLYAEIYSIVSQVPPGRVTTYGAVARALGDVRAARAVGRAMNLNPRAIVMPCHRVVAHDGSLGGFALGLGKKIEYLKREGVTVRDGFVEDFQDVLFTDFRPRPVLETMRREQAEVSERVVLHGDRPRYLVGMDVHYPVNGVKADRTTGEVKELGIAAAVMYDTVSGEVVDRWRARGYTRVPYIPSYLAYRELQVYKGLMDEMEIPEDAALVMDGNGVLHPRRAGIAAHMGVLTGWQALGVAKSRLCGDFDMNLLAKEGLAPVSVDGFHVGYACVPVKRARKPVFVSPGHRIDADTALEVMTPLFRYRVPTPVREAHMLAQSGGSLK